MTTFGDLVPGDVIAIEMPPYNWGFAAVLRLWPLPVSGWRPGDIIHLEVRGPGAYPSDNIFRGRHEQVRRLGWTDQEVVMQGRWNGEFRLAESTQDSAT